MLMQPARAFELSLEQSSVECVLIILRTKGRHGLNDFEPSKIRRMAHGRAPIPTPQGNVQHSRVCAEQLDYFLAIIPVDRLPQKLSDRVPVDPLLQLRPTGES